MLDHRPHHLRPSLRHHLRRRSAFVAAVASAALVAACGPSPTSDAIRPQTASPHLIVLPGAQQSMAGHPRVTPTRWPSYGPCPRTHITLLPEDSGCASQVVADFDGDGRGDRFIVYAHPLASDGTAQAWHVLLLMDNGQRYFRDLDMEATEGLNKGVVTAFDANQDGRAEAMVLVTMGASNDFTRWFDLWDTRIQQVRGPDGRPFEFNVGGSVLFGDGAGCRVVSGQPLAYTSAYWEKAGRWHWERTFYRWGGLGNLRLSEIRTRHGLTTERHAYRYAQFDCFDQHLGASTRPKVVY